jgi:hypothetical protein
MKFLRKHNLSSANPLDDTILQRLDGNIELNPTQQVVISGDVIIDGDLFVPNGIVPGPEVTNVMYVTMDGNDNNTGLGEGPRQAKRSIKSAVDAAQQGTTIFVKSGEYYENNPVRIPPKVSIVGDNLRRVIVRPLNGPQTYNIVNIQRTNRVTTITSDVPHGLTSETRIRVRCSNTAVDETDVNILEVPTPTTLTYRQFGEDISSTAAGGVFKWAPDFFLVNSQNYVTGIVFKGLQAPAYCVNIDDDAIVDTSPYIQNCSNINGPWMRNGEEWIPFVTEQPNSAGVMVKGPRPLLDDEINLSQVDVYGIDVEGAGSGMLIDGDRYSKQSPIKSMVGDAFTQVAQGAIGFHVTNFGYMQLVSCFAVFCSKAFYTTRGGYLSISNSVIDFGEEGFISDGFYLDPYATGNVSPEFYSTAGSVTVNSIGSGFTTPPIAVIDPPNPAIAGSRQATAEVSIDPILGIVNAISINDPGFGYDFQPAITITPSNGATATVNLAKNLTIDLSNLSSKPQVGSIMLLDNDPLGYYISGTLNDNQTFRYDEQKCIRDVGLIIDAVMADIVLGTNYRTVVAGLSYLRSYSSKVTSLQKSQTIAALTQAKTLTVDSTSNATVKTLIADHFDIVINIIDQGLSASPAVTMDTPVSAEAGFPEAAAILNANRQFIQDEIVAWLASAFSFSYNETKCKRDVELIIRAIVDDMVLGTNHQTRIAAFSYLRSYSSTVTEQQKLQTIDGINKAKELALLLVRDPITKSIVVANFKIVTDVLTTLDSQRAPAFEYTNPNNVNVGITNAAQQIFVNREFIVSEIVAFVAENLTPANYSAELWARDTEYLTDSILFDILYGGNSSTVNVARSFFNNSTNVVASQQSEHSSAYTRLKEVLGYVIDADDSWTKSAGNISVQDVSLSAGSIVATLKAEDLTDIVIDAIVSGAGTIPTPDVPAFANGSRFAFRNEERSLIINDLDNIKFNVIEFLNDKYNGNFNYNQATCRRDISYIIDAISYDLMYGGNSQTREAGLSYAEGSVILGQIEETQAAYEYWKEISKSILRNIEIVPSTGNTTLQDVSVLTGDPLDPEGPSAKVSTLLQIIIDVIDHGPGYVPEIPTNPEFDLYGDSTFLVERDIVLANVPSIQTATIFYINTTFGGTITVSVFPPIQSVTNGANASFHNVSTLSSGGTALEYVGAGVTYNALPFFGGQPDPEKERVEINNGKAFTVTSDQVGNYRVGQFFTVNALTGEVTINAENLNLSGLSSIGPFRRNGVPVGVQLQEVSDNSALIASTGFQDGKTVPTQRAVSAYVENRYLNKVQSDTPQTVESDVIFLKDVGINGGDVTTDQTIFNLVNTTATTVNIAGEATNVNIGGINGTTNINNDLDVYGNVLIRGTDGSTVGNLNTTAASFNILNTTPTTIVFGDAATSINIGSNTGVTTVNHNLEVKQNIILTSSTPSESSIESNSQTVNLLNSETETINLGGDAQTIIIGSATGATTINHTLYVDKDVFVGQDLSVNGNTMLGDDTTDTVTINGLLNINLPDNEPLVVDVVQGTDSYFKIDTVNSFEKVTFGTVPNIEILNTDDSVNKNTGALVVDGGVGVKKNLTVGLNLTVDGNTILGNERNTDLLSASGISNFNVPDNIVNVFEIRENLSSYIKIDTSDNNEYVDFGTTPVVRILNIKDSSSKDTGALVVEGGAGIERSLTVGVDLTVDRDATVTRNLAVNGGNLTTSNVTFNLVNTTATAVNFAGAATDIQIGSATGTTNVNNNLDVDGDVNIDGGDLTASAASFNLINTTVETVNFGSQATTINIGALTGTTTIRNASVVLDGDLQIKGGDLTTNQTTFNLVNATATTVNLAGAGTAVNIGAASGTTTVKNNLRVDADLQVEGGDLTTNQTTFNLLNTGVQTINAFGTGTAVNIGAATGNTTIKNSLIVDGNSTLGNSTADIFTITGSLASSLPDNTAAAADFKEGLNSYFKIDTTNSSEFVVFGSLPKLTSLNTTDATNSITAGATFAGGLAVAKQVWVGSNLRVDGNSTLGENRVSDATSINGQVIIDLPDNSSSAFSIVENLSSYVKINTVDTAELIEFGSAPRVSILNSTESTTKDTGALVIEGGVGIEFSLVSGLDVTSGRNITAGNNLAVNGGNLTSSASIFNLLNSTVGAVNFANDATAISIGSLTGDTTVRHNLIVTGDVSVNGGDLTTSQSVFNLINTSASAINFAGAGTAVNIGSTSGNTNVKNNLIVDLDLQVKGGDLTTNQSTFNLLNTNSTTVNFAGAATLIDIGAATGTTSINNNLDVDGNINVDGGSITTSLATINLLNSTATTVNAFGDANAVNIGSLASTITLKGTTQSSDINSGSLVVKGGAAIVKNLNVGGNLDVQGDISLNGDITANAFLSSSTVLQAPTIGNYAGERVRLYDFDNLTKTNYAIGAESDHVWMGVDSNNEQQGFKWYGETVQLMRLSAAGNLSLVGNAAISGDIAVNGGDLTTTASTFNLVNATATTVNFASAATAIEIGASTGSTTVNNNLNVDGDFRLGSDVIFYNQGANGFSVNTDYDISNTATQTGYTFSSGSGRTGTILALGVTGEFNNYVGVTGSSTSNKFVIGSTGVNTTFEIRNNSGVTPVDLSNGSLLLSVASSGNVSVKGNLEVKGGSVTTDQTTFNLVNAIATTVNAFGSATAVTIGASSGSTTVRNNLEVILDVAANGGDVTTTATTFNLINANAATVNFAGAGSVINIGAATGTTTIRNANVVLDGSLQIKGNNLTTDRMTFNLLNDTATTINAFNAATLISIGSTTGTTTVRNKLIVSADLAANGGDLTTNQTTFNLVDTTATTVNFAREATSTNIGATTGTTTIRNANTVVTGDLAVNGGDLTTAATTFNLVNANAATVNFAGAADNVIIGSAIGTTSFNNHVIIDGNLTVSGTTTTVNTEELFVADNIITLNSNYQGSTPTENSGIEVNRGDLANSSVIWDETNGYWTLDNGTGTRFIIQNTGRDVVLGTETSGSYIATVTGTANQVVVDNSGLETANITISLPQDIHSGASPQFVNQLLTGDLAVNGGDVTTTATTFNLVNANAATVNFAGAATAIEIGAATGTLTINNKETVFDSTSHITIPVGVTSQRAAIPVPGMIRYNTELTTFEGYATAWGSLGGVKDVDGNTYIIPETSPGSNENILYFYNDGIKTAELSVDSMSFLQNTSSTNTTSGSLVVTGGVGISQNAHIGGTLNTTGAVVFSNTLAVTGDSLLTGDLAVNGGDVTTTATTFNLVNANAVTVNFAGAATVVEIGSSAGTTNVNNNLIVDLDVQIKGGDITTNQTTFNLLPTTVTTGNLFDVATIVNIAKSAAAANTTLVGPEITGNSIVLNSTANGSVSVDSIVSTGTVNLFAGITTGTVNLATTNGSTVNIGGIGSSTNIAELILTTDLAVEFGGTGQSTFTENGIVYGNTADGLLVTAASDPGVSNASTSFGILTTDINNVPVWTDTIDEGEY